jgi:hypothetical protein
MGLLWVIIIPVSLGSLVALLVHLGIKYGRQDDCDSGLVYKD